MAKRDDRPRVTCSCCQGTGKALLPASLFQALRLMRRLGTLSAPELAAATRALGTERKSLTFANQRLEKLRELGLAFRAKSDSGRAFRYYEACHGIAVQSLKGAR